jgi:hypothetical protein
MHELRVNHPLDALTTVSASSQHPPFVQWKNLVRHCRETGDVGEDRRKDVRDDSVPAR